MTDSTNPRVMADNIKELAALSGSQAADISALRVYSTNEIETGETWLDKPIYKKTFNIDALPESSTENIPHGIENINDILSIISVAQIKEPAPARSLPFAGSILVQLSSTNLILTTTSNTSQPVIITVKYTKAAPAPDVSPDPDLRSLEEPEAGTGTEEPINEELKKEEK